MRTLFLLLFLCFSLSACRDATEPNEDQIVSAKGRDYSGYSLVGEKFEPEKVITSEEMGKSYSNMKVGDSLEVVFGSTVKSVCKNKGCWMKMKIDNSDVMVKFKDYGFFVPKNIENKEVVVRGKAFVTEVSVQEQQHLAEDAGESPEEVAKIIAPQKTFTFLADGVLIEP